MNQQFVVLDSRYQLSVYACAFRTAHENLYICVLHVELYKLIFQSVMESDQIQPHQNVLQFLRFSQQIDQEFCDHMLLNECEFFLLPLFSLLFRLFYNRHSPRKFPHTRHGKAAGCVSNLPYHRSQRPTFLLY